jgi:hypothetical protein
MSKFIKEYKKIIDVICVPKKPLDEYNSFELEKNIQENQKQILQYKKLLIEYFNSKENKSDLNITKDEYSKMIFENCGKKLIVESSLSRLWNHVENKRPFAIISWQRGDMNNPSSENVSPRKTKLVAFDLLKQEVRRLGYGFIELLGGYVERGSDDQPVDIVDELSICVPNISLREALTLGNVDLGFGPQDSILYSNGSKIALHNTNENFGNIGDVVMSFKYGEGREALPMAQDAVKEYFSQLKKGSHVGKKFAFVPFQESHTFKLLELKDRKTPRKSGYGWWANFGIRVL